MWFCASAGIWPSEADRCKHAQIKAARGFGHAAVEKDEPEEQDEAPGREIDRDLPGGGVAVSAAPDSDEEERRDERELVEGVEEKQIERSEGAERAGRDEQEAGVKGVLVLAIFPVNQTAASVTIAVKQDHHQAEAVEAEDEVQMPICADRDGGDEAEALVRALEAEEDRARQRADSGRRR